MPNLNIEVKNKIAIGDNTKIVCDNSDYIVNFNLDQEWDNFSTKTMRVRYSNNEYTDYVFNGTSCKLPVITDKTAIEIGLYAGNLHTTSGAAYECIGSILGGAGTQVEPAQNIYNQIIQLLDDLDWSTLPHKPFETIGTGLEVNDQGVLFNTGAGGSFNIHELSEAKVISNDDEIPVYIIAENRTKKILWKTIETQLKTSFDGFYAAIKHKHTVNDITDFPTIPTKTSDLENDSGFITSLDVPAVLYTEQVLTPDQQTQARTNIGAGQPVFAVNVTMHYNEQGREEYTADKTAAEIEAAYQAGRTIVCKTQADFWIASIPVELPLVSRNQERVFIFAVDQLMGENTIFTITVNISDSGVEANAREVEIYKRPVGGIPKSDLADDVQTSLDKADTAISLGLTAATPGQIIKVKTVQDGKPTKWEAVDMPGGGGDEWELIAHINVADDVEKDVTVWQYNNLPRYKCIAYKKVNLVGSSEQKASGCIILINNETSQPSGMSYGKSGSPQSCIGMIYVTPFGWTHCKTGDSNTPTNYAFSGVSAMYNALPLSDNAITSIKLLAHSTYKIASGEIWLYGKKG